MSILETVKAQQLAARKSGDTIARNLLTTLLGEISTAQKNGTVNDDAVSAIVVKFIKNAKEIVRLQPDQDKRNIAQAEIDILQNLLPQQLDQAQLTIVIGNLMTSNNISTTKQFGVLMKLLKDQYSNQYDAGMASTIVKGLLK